MQIAASSLISAFITSELPTQHTVKLVMVEDVEAPDFLLHVLSVTLLSSVKTTGTPIGQPAGSSFHKSLMPPSQSLFLTVWYCWVYTLILAHLFLCNSLSISSIGLKDYEFN